MERNVDRLQYPLDSQDMMEEDSHSKEQIEKEQESPPKSIKQEAISEPNTNYRSQLPSQHQEMITHYWVSFGQKLINIKPQKDQSQNRGDDDRDLKVKQQKYQPPTPEGLEVFQNLAKRNIQVAHKYYSREFKHYNQVHDELIKLEAEYSELATTHPEKISQIEQIIRTNRLTEAQVEQKRRGKRYQYSHRKNIVLMILNSYSKFKTSQSKYQREFTGYQMTKRFHLVHQEAG